MIIEPFLFAITSFASVLLYYPTANGGKFIQRSVTDFETTYWNAFQVFMWSLAVILFRNGPAPSVWASMAVLPTTLLYGLIAEQHGMDFDLTGNTPLSPLQIGVLSGIGALIVLYLIVLLYNQDYQNPISIFWKFLPLLVFIVWLLTWLGVNKTVESSFKTTTRHIAPGYDPKTHATYYKGGTSTINEYTSAILHIHHWIIGVIGFLLANDSAVYSQIIAGIFWGVFCQEAASYGIATPYDSRQTFVYNFQPDAPSLGPGGIQPDAPKLGPGGTQQLLNSWQAHYR